MKFANIDHVDCEHFVIAGISGIRVAKRHLFVPFPICYGDIDIEQKGLPGDRSS